MGKFFSSAKVQTGWPKATLQRTSFKFFLFSLLKLHHFPLALLHSIIFDRLSKNGRMYEEATTKHLNEYGESGLRTLALAYRKLEESEYSAWNSEFMKAKTSIGADREAMLERVSDMMERDLILVGATAIEDKLQKGVCLKLLFVSSLSPSFVYVFICFIVACRCLSALINWHKLV